MASWSDFESHLCVEKALRRCAAIGLILRWANANSLIPIIIYFCGKCARRRRIEIIMTVYGDGAAFSRIQTSK